MSRRPKAFDRDKFAELMIYIANKCADKANFGATHLNKILFFSDFLAYAHHGESITGATYRRLDRGPVPKELLPVQKELDDAGASFVQERPVGSGRVQKRLIARRQANLDFFKPQEIALIDDAIERCIQRNAQEVSDHSHDQSPGWHIAGDREEIPYQTVFLTLDVTVPPSVVRRGQQIAQEHGWL